MGKPTATIHGQNGSSNGQSSRNTSLEGGGSSGRAESIPATRPGHRNKQGGSKKYEFVLVTDSESRTQVRRHAMRQYVHRRRQDGIARLESTRVQLSGWSTGKSPGSESPAGKVEELDTDENTLFDAQGSCESSQYGENSYESSPGNCYDFKEQGLSNMVNSDNSHGLVSLKSEPSPDSPDPFRSYPLQLNRSDYSLIDHCKFYTRDRGSWCIFYCTSKSCFLIPLGFVFFSPCFAIPV